MDAPQPGDLTALLRRWYDGDRAALEAILGEHLPYIEQVVRHRLGPVLRAKGETQDYVQDAVREFLRFGPRFVPASAAQFRALLARIVESVLHDEHDWYTARRRDLARERPLPGDTVLYLDAPRQRVEAPSEEAMRDEDEARVRFALEFLSLEERRVLLLRQWDRQSFKEVGVALGVAEDAARMRFSRALAHLGDVLARLRSGDLGDLLEESATAPRAE